MRVAKRAKVTTGPCPAPWVDHAKNDADTETMPAEKFAGLPDEVVSARILPRLALEDLVRFGAVDKRCSNLARADVLWKPYWEALWPPNQPVPALPLTASFREAWMEYKGPAYRSLSPEQILRGHTGAVIAVDVDEKHVILGSADCTATLWNREDGVLCTTLSGHMGAVNSVALSAELAATACTADNTIKTWSIASGVLLKTLSPGDEGVRRVIFYDGILISAGSHPDDSTARTWPDLAFFSLPWPGVGEIAKHAEGVWSLRASADRLMLLDNYSNLNIYERGEISARFTGRFFTEGLPLIDEDIDEADTGLCLADISVEGDTLVGCLMPISSGGERSHCTRVWSLSRRELLQEWHGFGAYESAILGDAVIVSLADYQKTWVNLRGVLCTEAAESDRMWSDECGVLSIATGALQHRLPGTSGTVAAHSNTIVASGTTPGTAKLWRLGK